MLEVWKRESNRVLQVERIGDALELTLRYGKLRLEPKSAEIVRVRYTLRETFAAEAGIGILNDPVCGEWAWGEDAESVALQTSALVCRINRETASIRYETPSGTLLLAERAYEARELEPFTSYRISGEAVIEEVATPDGVKQVVREAAKEADRELYHTTLHLQFQENEHIYGLGQAGEGNLDLRGTCQYLHQANRKIAIPFFVSTKGYGLLSASGSPAIFRDDSYGTYLRTEADVEMDTYFLRGETLDAVIHGYRFLTGKAAMLPAWAFGYMQSQERYETQEEIVDIATEYRRRGIGLDSVVLDWCSWKDGLWGEKHFDAERFPDPSAMTETLHQEDVHFMISIWPNMDEKGENYREFRERNLLLPASNIYDAFNPEGRALYWNQAEEGLFRHGIDAWWCDSSEPYAPEWERPVRPDPAEQYHDYTQAVPLHIPAEKSNAYGLVHAEAMYEGQRGSGSPKRVINLTRNTYTGGQRYGVILWSGDTEASWETFRRQIAAGLNFCASGFPYWTLDIGAFFVKHGMQWFWRGEYPLGLEDFGYQELYTRWFQYGAFLPIFRAHGTDVRREMWAFSEPYYGALVEAGRLRYRLLPYIYSLAGQVYLEDKTMMRLLAFDFASDETACRVRDEFLLGENLLVCPVTEPGAISRQVYLPEGADWYDFYTGERLVGGRWGTVSAPLDRIPLFVKAGSIIPMAGGHPQHVREALCGPIELHVWPDKSCTYTYYEDAGDGYGYEQGEYTITKCHWDEVTQKLVLDRNEARFIIVLEGEDPS